MTLHSIHRKRRAGESGFTLLEVMISLAIVAGVLLTVINAVNHHLSMVERARRETSGILLARQKMSELEGERGLPARRDGTFAPAHPGFAWEMTTTTMEQAPLHRMTITVSWDDGKRNVTLVRYQAH